MYPKDHWTIKTRYFEDPTPAIQVQIPFHSKILRVGKYTFRPMDGGWGYTTLERIDAGPRDSHSSWWISWPRKLFATFWEWLASHLLSLWVPSEHPSPKFLTHTMYHQCIWYVSNLWMKLKVIWSYLQELKFEKKKNEGRFFWGVIVLAFTMALAKVNKQKLYTVLQRNTENT